MSEYSYTIEYYDNSKNQWIADYHSKFLYEVLDEFEKRKVSSGQKIRLVSRETTVMLEWSTQ